MVLTKTKYFYVVDSLIKFWNFEQWPFSIMFENHDVEHFSWDQMSIEVRKAKTALYWQSYYPQIRVSSRVNVTQHQRKLVRTSIDLNHSGVKTVVTLKSYKIHARIVWAIKRLHRWTKQTRFRKNKSCTCFSRHSK